MPKSNDDEKLFSKKAVKKKEKGKSKQGKMNEKSNQKAVRTRAKNREEKRTALFVLNEEKDDKDPNVVRYLLSIGYFYTTYKKQKAIRFYKSLVTKDKVINQSIPYLDLLLQLASSEYYTLEMKEILFVFEREAREKEYYIY